MTPLSIVDAMRELFGDEFQRPSWSTWLAVLASAFAVPLDAEQLRLFATVAGDRRPPLQRVGELWAIAGRRAGKSRMAALIALLIALFYKPERLAPGETPVVMLLAADRAQAKVLLEYVRGFLRSSLVLEGQIVRELEERIDLANGVRIEVHSSSYRAVRGRTLIAALCDEVAFWPNDEQGASPDVEVLAALRPALTTCNGMLICISSPYARRGELWRSFREHHGKDVPDVLVVRGASRTFNPDLPESLIARELERDEARASSEYLAMFRSDIETFLSREAVEAVVNPARPLELPPLSAHSYSAFADPSGGSGDSFTLAIGHKEGDRVVIDVVRERRPPFSPDAVTSEFSALLRSYRISKVVGDRYGGEWPRERFGKHGVDYKPAARPKSELYAALLSVVHSAHVELPADRRLVAQIVGLERRTARGGRDSIDHAPGGHDDVANAVAGLVHQLTQRRGVGWADLYPPPLPREGDRSSAK
jgi:hypothetical protein